MRLSSLLLLSLTLIIQYIKSNELRDSNNAADDPKSYDPSQIKLVEENLEKSTLDDNKYKVIKLPNGIEVALASDPSAFLASVSVAVRTGSKDDPKDFPGLAHLCEYMLFMGTKKYPEKNEYASFVLSNGGSFDSYTALERTVFITEINHKYHFELLNRISNFFIEPLFNEESIERETHAINSEYEEHRSSLTKLKFHFFNYILKDTGYFPEFTTGNRQTLFSKPRASKKNVRDALNDFFKKNYRSYDIKVAIYGNESLDVLQEWAVNTFGQIPNSGARVVNDINPFSLISRNHHWYNLTNSSYALDLAFIVPSTASHYKSVPQHYLNYVFSYSGPRTPVHHLSSNILASKIEITSVPYSSKYDILFFTFTPQYVGRLFYEQIIKEFFNCLKFFQDKGPNKDVFEDIMKAQNLNFKYSFKDSASKLVEKLSTAMLADSLPRRYLLKKDVAKEYDENEISELFSELRYDNFISFANTVRKSYNETDPYYKFLFRKESYKKELLQGLQNSSAPELVFPPKNIHISEPKITLEKLNESITKPDLLKKTSLSTLWHKHGSLFYSPYAVIRILLRNPSFSSTPTNILRMRLLVHYIYVFVKFDIFFLSMVNTHLHIEPSQQGLIITLYGYSDGMLELVSNIVNVLKEVNLDQQSFRDLRQTLLYVYKERTLLGPSEFLEIDIDDVLLSERQPLKNMLSTLEGFQHYEVNAHFYHLLSNLHFDILITGNINQEDASHVLDMFEELKPRPLISSQYSNARSITLGNGSDYLHLYEITKKDIKSGLLMYFEATEMNDSRKTLLLFLLYLILREPIYYELRIKEQLGYVIRSSVKTSRTILGYYFVLQSERQPHVLHTRVEAFLDTMHTRLLNMTSEQLNIHLENLEYFLNRNPLDILSESYRIWNEIAQSTYNFDSNEERKSVDLIKLNDIVQLFEEVFYSRKRRISYYALSPTGADTYNVFDLPLDKLSEYLTTKGENLSKDQLSEFVLLSHDIPSFRTKLTQHFSAANKNKTVVNSLLDGTFTYLEELYKSEKEKVFETLDLIEDLAYFKANMSFSSAFINRTLWSKFYK
ncbi:hypothetical protein T552_03304 [Pneumocystis carinii B80]|uniref:Peptidase M16 N-terminal domain-containing protein n=1 Tax=Pneumocystis carinii (strain B80) TaxID=1408658 RepID=A0A0W4ZCA0_PNEC8|nr:hypothetical protein T552_03304 [Pneumocystis carinii B80]KTW26036.1 hypothetical protein T552_03304 [Pneumocystis carinii B80]